MRRRAFIAGLGGAAARPMMAPSSVDGVDGLLAASACPETRRAA